MSEGSSLAADLGNGISPYDVEEFARALDAAPLRSAESWKPWFVRLRPGEFARLEEVCRTYRVHLVDEIDRQLADYAMILRPAADDAARRRDVIEQMVGEASGRASLGNWVYLPWDGRLVHLLDRNQHFEVITDRNADKITRDERAVLCGKRVGVMGLSVGGEAAVTVAQEHLCGEMVLADFDRLDLSNLNRIGSGFDELGHNKTVIVARRITRINPYLPLTVYEDGVTDQNIDKFLDGLDLLIEECDGLRLKFEVRRKARDRGLNLVFAADERGFLSVEPYEACSALSPFHGKIATPPKPKEDYATPLEFMKALTEWMGGWDAISERSRRSLERLGVDRCGYPQLASEARFAAGQVGHVARRLLLGERVPPFVGNMDLEELVR